MGNCFLHNQNGGSGNSMTIVEGTVTSPSTTSNSNKVYVDVGFEPDIIVLAANPGVVTTYVGVHVGEMKIGNFDMTDEFYSGWSGEIVSGSSIYRAQQIVQRTDTGFSLRAVDGQYGLNRLFNYKVYKFN